MSGVFDAFLRLFRRKTPVPLAGLDPQRTRLVVGLGNPGPEYAETRHNIGFRIVDLMARRANALWQDRVDSMSSMVAVTNTTAGQALVLAKPQTFMNRSGTAARRLIEFLNLPSSHVLVVYDDMDLPFGSLRLRERGSAGTHNGMRSVVKALGPDIARLRVGIGQSPPGAATDHVLSEFAPAEAPAVEALIERAADAATDWAERGAVAAMNQYNKA